MKAIFLLVVTVFGLPLIVLSQEEGRKGPVHFKVELENDSIVVLRIRLDPHEKTPMHQVTPRVVVWLTDSHLRDTFADGKTIELRRSAGTTEWIPAQEHSGENLSDKPIEFIAIVPKEISGRAKNKSTFH
jgi:quercetin dioxygenase-like cupin family protein